MLNKNSKKQDKINDILNKVSLVILMVTLFLLPLIFLPTSIATFSATKTTFLALGVFLALIFIIIQKLKEDSFKIPLNILSLSIVLMPITYAFATLFSSNMQISFIGKDFLYDNFLFILVLFILLTLSSVIFNKKQNTIYFYLSLGLSLSVIVFAYLFNLFFPQIFPDLNFFFNNTSNTVGKLNDLAIFAGIGLILSLISLDITSFSKKINMGFYALGSLSFLVILIINFNILWYLIGIFSLLLLIAILTSQKITPSEKKKFPTASFTVFIISVVILISGGLVNSFVGQVVTVDYVEIRPSLTTTGDLLVTSIQEAPFFGIGPSRFDIFWNEHKTKDIIASDYWNTNFNFAFSFISSLIVTVGIIGLLPWILFFGAYLYFGISAFQNKKQDQLEKYITGSSFVTSIYLWILFIVYVPGLVIFAFTMVFTGLCIASLYRQNILKYTEVNIAGNPRSGFLYISTLIIILILLISGGYHYVKKFTADYYTQKSAQAFQNNEIDNAFNYSMLAYSLFNTDVYLKNISQIESTRLGVLVNNQEISNEDKINLVRNGLISSINIAQTAIEYDDENYANYVQLASIYEYSIPFGFAESYENAKKFYTDSLKYNPQNPSIYLNLARLEVGQKNNFAAKELIKKALDIKPNYVEAVFLLSEIDILEGNMSKAVSNMEAVLALKPKDPLIHFKLGVLKYQNKNFTGAIISFENAVILNQFYSNAKYLLALSYIEVGRTQDAINQFTDLELLNPDNEEIKILLGKLKRGERLYELQLVEDVIEEESPNTVEEIGV